MIQHKSEEKQINQKEELSFISYTNKYKDQVIDLLKHLWKDRDYAQRKQLFEWKYEQNPFIPNLTFVAVVNETVVGFRGYTVNPSNVNNSINFYTVCLADAVTDPNKRGMGIFKRLTVYSVKSLNDSSKIKAILALSSNKSSTPGYLKFGWRKLADNNPVFKISLFGLLKQVIKSEDKFRKKETTKGSLTYKFSNTLDFDVKKLEQLAKKNINPNKISTIKGSIWYKWRLSNPTKNYYLSTCWKDGQLVGFFLLNKSKKYWAIIDYLFEDTEILKSLLSSTLKEFKPSVLMLWTISKENNLIRVFRKKGFFSFSLLLNMLNKTLEPVLVRTTKINQTEENWKMEKYDIRNLKCWDINLFDSDAS